jgi:hypothetical protein
MAWRRAQEGYLLIDNRFAVQNAPNPFLPEADVQRAQAAGYDVVGVRDPLFESATVTCSHCNAIVVLRPDRTRERGYCPPCDAYICDACAWRRGRGERCVPIVKVLDVLQKRAEMTLRRS